MEAIASHSASLGAIASFVGVVRDMAGDGGPSSMTLEHYPGMTEEDAARDRRGGLPPLAAGGEPRHFTATAASSRGTGSCWWWTASAHRQAALEACAFLIDWLKTKAPLLETRGNTGRQPLGEGPRPAMTMPRPAGTRSDPAADRRGPLLHSCHTVETHLDYALRVPFGRCRRQRACSTRNS